MIYLSESVRRGSILIGCDIYWGPSREAHADAGIKLNRLDRFEVNKSDDNLWYNSWQKFSSIYQQNQRRWSQF